MAGIGPCARRQVTRQVTHVPGVTKITPDTLIPVSGTVANVSNDPLSDQQWYLQNRGDQYLVNPGDMTAGADADVPPAWAYTRGNGVTVAVIDTGMDISNPDLAGALWTNPDEPCGSSTDLDGDGYVGDCHGWDFTDDNGTGQLHPTVSAHGTAVSGIIAATGGNGIGITGIAPDAKIMPLDVSVGGIYLSESGIEAAIQYAIDHHADIINLSLGGLGAIPSGLQTELDAAQAAGVLVVAAAGNWGLNLDTDAEYPAGASVTNTNILAVGASNPDDTPTDWSDYSPTAIQAFAPGNDLMTTTLSSSTGGFALFSGTSAAAPVVAGEAALVKSLNPNLSPAEIIQSIESTSEQIPALDGYGVSGGRVDIAAAVRSVANAASTIHYAFDGFDNLTGSTQNMNVQVRADSSAIPTGDQTSLSLTLATRVGPDHGRHRLPAECHRPRWQPDDHHHRRFRDRDADRCDRVVPGRQRRDLRFDHRPPRRLVRVGDATQRRHVRPTPRQSRSGRLRCRRELGAHAEHLGGVDDEHFGGVDADHERHHDHKRQRDDNRHRDHHDRRGDHDHRFLDHYQRARHLDHRVRRNVDVHVDIGAGINDDDRSCRLDHDRLVDRVEHDRRGDDNDGSTAAAAGPADRAHRDGRRRHGHVVVVGAERRRERLSRRRRSEPRRADRRARHHVHRHAGRTDLRLRGLGLHDLWRECPDRDRLGNSGGSDDNRRADIQHERGCRDDDLLDGRADVDDGTGKSLPGEPELRAGRRWDRDFRHRAGHAGRRRDLHRRRGGDRRRARESRLVHGDDRCERRPRHLRRADHRQLGEHHHDPECLHLPERFRHHEHHTRHGTGYDRRHHAVRELDNREPDHDDATDDGFAHHDIGHRADGRRTHAVGRTTRRPDERLSPGLWDGAVCKTPTC